MFWLFKLKGWNPSKYYWLPPGEKIIVRAFMEKEIEERNEAIKELSKT